MTVLRERMTEDMQVRNLSPHTQSSYLQRVSLFARYFRMSPDALNPRAHPDLPDLPREREEAGPQFNPYGCAFPTRTSSAHHRAQNRINACPNQAWANFECCL
jgi:hypothetical protein